MVAKVDEHEFSAFNHEYMNDDATYDIFEEGNPTIPGLGGRGRLLPNLFEVVDAMSAELSMAAHPRENSAEFLHLVLWPTPLTMRLIRSMLMDPAHRAFPWRRTELWFAHGDEEGTPPLASDIAVMLIEHGGLPASKCHGFDRGWELARDFEWNSQGCIVDARGAIIPDCAIIGLDGDRGHALRNSDTMKDERRVHECEARCGIDESVVRACSTIIAAGTMTHVEAVRSLADRIGQDHPGLSWFLSRAEEEESH